MCAFATTDANKHKKVIEIRLHNNEINVCIIKRSKKYVVAINKVLKFRHELAAKKKN